MIKNLLYFVTILFVGLLSRNVHAVWRDMPACTVPVVIQNSIAAPTYATNSRDRRIRIRVYSADGPRRLYVNGSVKRGYGEKYQTAGAVLPVGPGVKYTVYVDFLDMKRSGKAQQKMCKQHCHIQKYVFAWPKRLYAPNWRNISCIRGDQPGDAFPHFCAHKICSNKSAYLLLKVGSDSKLTPIVRYRNAHGLQQVALNSHPKITTGGDWRNKFSAKERESYVFFPKRIGVFNQCRPCRDFETP